MVWCQRKKFELKQKMLWLYFFSLDKNYLRQICKTVSHKKAGQNLKKKTKYFSPPFFSSPKYPIFKCVHDIFYFFFPEDQTNQKCFSLGLSKKSLIGPKWWCFVVQYFIFLRPVTQSFGTNQKNAFNSLLICGLIDPPCFPTSLVCHTVGPLHFQGLCLQGYDCSRIREASVSGCLRQWLPVPSDSNTQFFPTIVPHAPIIQREGISPTNTIRIFLFSLL